MKTRVFTPPTIRAIANTLPPSALLDTDRTGKPLTVPAGPPSPGPLPQSTTKHLTVTTADRTIATITTSFNPPDVANAANHLFTTITDRGKVAA